MLTNLKEAELLQGLGHPKAFEDSEAIMISPPAEAPLELRNEKSEALTLADLEAYNPGTLTLQLQVEELVHPNEMQAQKRKRWMRLIKATSFQKVPGETETRLHGHVVSTHWHDRLLNYPYIP